MLKVLLEGQCAKTKTTLGELCPRLRDGNKRTVMHFAAATDRVDIVQFLHDACKDLVTMADSEDSTPLHLAAAAGSAAACKALLVNGADVHAARSQGEQAIHLAARNGRLDVLTVLLEHGASPSSMGEHGTALHEAAGDDEAGALEILLEALSRAVGAASAGGEVADVIAELDRPSPKGPTPLVMAAAMGGVKAAAVLVEAGARLDTGAIHGLTALHLFADRGNAAGIRAVLSCPGGSEAAAPAELGGAAQHQEDSPRLLASDRIRLACSARSSDGMIPLQLALASMHSESAMLLLEHSRASLPEAERGLDVDALMEAYIKHGEEDREAKELAQAQAQAEEARMAASSWNPRDPPRHPVPGSPDGDNYADLGPVPDASSVPDAAKREAGEWKYRGDGAIKAQRFMEAVGFYKQAIALDPTNHAVYSNRSLALLRLNQGALALQDARRCRRLAPWFVKGCYREGMARMAMMDFHRASQVFWTAYCMDNDNYEMAELFKEAVAKGKTIAARERGEDPSDDEDEDEDEEQTEAASGEGEEAVPSLAEIDE